jgi:eukaryotic-like serine/threonine-protein kinase
MIHSGDQVIGQTVSHYKILEKLGEGGMGVVYKAEDTRLKRTVALKFLPPALTCDPAAKERFVHEAQAASALEHANICSIHEIAEHDGQTFIVMGYYEGRTLKEKIENGGLKIEDGIDIAIQIAEGLARAHEAGIVHRDIKPANLFLTTHNEVKILDFGLAKLSGQTILTRTGSTLGTAAYMSPEQAKGEPVDHRTDIWSLGVVMYEMLTGKRPFASDYAQALTYEILNEEPKPLRYLRPEVPETLEQCVLKALAKKPEERYQKAEDFLSDLKEARTPEQTGMTIAAAEARERKKRKNRMRVIVGVGVAVLLLAGLFFIALPLMQDQALASNPKSVAFISFENNTGDASLSYLHRALPVFLGSTLEDSKYLRLVSSDRLRELMQQIGKDSVEFIDKQTGLQLCRRARIDVMGAGRFTKAGPVFLTEIELIDVSSGQRLGKVLKARGQGEESLLEPGGIVDDLARQVSQGLGISLLNTQASVKTVTEVTSSSMEAQRFYLKGQMETSRFNWREARTQFELAVKEDSTFAAAWYRLWRACANLGDQPAWVLAAKQAVRYSSKVTEREKYLIAEIDSSLRVSLLGQEGFQDSVFFPARVERFPFDSEFRYQYALFFVDASAYFKDRDTRPDAIAQLEEVLRRDPGYGEAYNQLAYLYVATGRGTEAIAALERLAELQPGEPNPLHSQAECLMLLGRYDDAIPRCERALQAKPDFYGALLTLAKLYFMKEQYENALSWVNRGVEIPDPRIRADHLWWRAWFLLWAGRLKEADASLQESEKIATAQTSIDHELVFWRTGWLKGSVASEKGDFRKARKAFSSWSKDKPGEARVILEFWKGMLDLQQGESDSIEVRLQRMRDSISSLTRKYPQHTKHLEGLWRYYGNALRAAYLLALHRPGEIRPNWIPPRWFIEYPDSVVTASWPMRYPFWWGPSTNTWSPVPFDIVPRAYAERGMIDSAIAAYEVALKKPPHPMGPAIPRYYCRVARLYEQKGMKEKAIENYTHFLEIWGKADPVYKEPRDARRRLARLKAMVRP